MLALTISVHGFLLTLIIFPIIPLISIITNPKKIAVLWFLNPL